MGDVLSYGWRILFVIGFLAAVTGIIIRVRLEESPLFKEVEQRHQKLDSPASTVWREKPGLILHLSLLNAGLGAAFWLSQVFGVSYMYLTGIPEGQASLTNVYAALVAMVLMYIGGILADRYGRKAVIFTGLIFMVALAYPYILAIGSGNYALVVMAQVLFFSLTYGLAYPAQPAFYAEHFATSYRASGVNNAYQISQVYGGGLAPILATYIVSVTGGAKLAWPYLVVMIALYGIIAMAGILTFRETKEVDLATIPA
jgi:MFS family permease